MAARKDNTAALINLLEQHMKEDMANFHKLTEQLIEVNKDVKSLLTSRTFLRGVWWTVGTLGTIVGAVVTLIFKWWHSNG